MFCGGTAIPADHRLPAFSSIVRRGGASAGRGLAHNRLGGRPRRSPRPPVGFVDGVSTTHAQDAARSARRMIMVHGGSVPRDRQGGVPPACRRPSQPPRTAAIAGRCCEATARPFAPTRSSGANAIALASSFCFAGRASTWWSGGTDNHPDLLLPHLRGNRRQARAVPDRARIEPTSTRSLRRPRNQFDRPACSSVPRSPQPHSA